MSYPKSLVELCKKYKYKLLQVNLLCDGDVNGECDYSTRMITIAAKYRDDYGRIRSHAPEEMLFTLAHEIAHMVAFEEGDDDEEKLADAQETLDDEEAPRANRLSALRAMYRHEIQTDYRAAELLKSLQLWQPSFINYVITTHLLYHRHYQQITLGKYCMAGVRRIPKLSFKNIWQAKIDQNVIKLLNKFMTDYPQSVGGTRNEK